MAANAGHVIGSDYWMPETSHSFISSLNSDRRFVGSVIAVHTTNSFSHVLRADVLTSYVELVLLVIDPAIQIRVELHHLQTDFPNSGEQSIMTRGTNHAIRWRK